MSWGTCYNAPNNIHFDYPANMTDGRTFTAWGSSYAMNETFKKTENISSNRVYKEYLIRNTDNIMKYNKSHAFNYNCGVPVNQSTYHGTPYVFKNSHDKSRPYGYADSTLKNMYLSRQELQSKMISPFLQPR